MEEKDEIKDLTQKTKNLKNELEYLINTNAEKSVVCLKGIELELTMALLINKSKNNAIHNKKILGKYANLLETDFKDELISKMKADIQKKFTNYSEDELNYFCEILYIICTLKAYKITEDEIIKQVMYRNSLFWDKMNKKGIDIKEYNPNLPLDFYTKLNNKYLKIIKERIKLGND